MDELLAEQDSEDTGEINDVQASMALKTLDPNFDNDAIVSYLRTGFGIHEEEAVLVVAENLAITRKI